MRSKKAILNLVFSFFFQIITLCMGFIIPRLLIKYYGEDFYGIYASAKQFIATMTIVEAGIGLACITALYKPLALNLRDKIEPILSAARSYYNRVSFFFFLLIAVLAGIYPLFVEIDNSHHYITIFIIILGFAGLSDYLFTGKYQVLIRADGKEYAVAIVGTIVSVLVLSVFVLLASPATDPIYVFALFVPIYFLKPLLLGFYTKKIYGFTYHKNADFSQIKQKGDIYIHQLTTIILNNTDIILITIFFSLTDVSVYAIYALVFMGISRLVQVSTSGLIYNLGNVIVLEDKNKVNDIFNKIEFIFYNLISVLYTVTAIMILPFVHIYTTGITETNYVIPVFMILFASAEILNKYRIPCNLLVSAAGLFKETRNRAITEMSLNIVFSLIGIYLMGFYGVLLGTIISFIYRTTDFIFFTSKRILQRTPLITIKKILLSFVPMILCFWLLNGYFLYEPESFAAWIWAVALTGLIAISVNLLFNILFNRSSMLESITYLSQRFRQLKTPKGL